MATSRTRSGTGKAAPRSRSAASAASETDKKTTETDERTAQLRALAAETPAAQAMSDAVDAHPGVQQLDEQAAEQVEDATARARPTVTHNPTADEPVPPQATVTDAPTTPQPDTESADDAETPSAKAAAQLGVPETDGIAAAAATATELPDNDESPKRDLAALRALADTSGIDPVTPYPADGITAPNPALVLPPLRDTHTWLQDGDKPLTARVLADGWRVRMNYGYRFARKGDRVTAPDDVLRQAASQGLVHIEE